jgi:hypothetical protein
LEAVTTWSSMVAAFAANGTRLAAAMTVLARAPMVKLWNILFIFLLLDTDVLFGSDGDAGVGFSPPIRPHESRWTREALHRPCQMPSS